MITTGASTPMQSQMPVTASHASGNPTRQPTATGAAATANSTIPDTAQKQADATPQKRVKIVLRTKSTPNAGSGKEKAKNVVIPKRTELVCPVCRKPVKTKSELK